MLSIDNINAFYGDSRILHDLSLSMGDRQRIAILGRNGAGKSTLLKSIMNAGPTITGRILWNSEDLGVTPAFKRSRMGLCLVPEDRRIIGHLTVLENLKMASGGVPKGIRQGNAEEVLRRFPLLAPFRDRKGAFLSGGQQQVLALARAALSQPRLLLLDEPTEGLAPIIVQTLVNDVATMCAANDSALLLCEQNIWFAQKCTDYVYVLDSGRIVFGGTWSDFENNREIRARHLAI